MAERPPSQIKAPRTPALTPIGPHEGRPPILLSRPVTLVGSRQNARLHLMSRTVSKAHALIVVSNDRVYIRDLASRSGVIINGEAVREADLQDGDRIEVGSFTFRFTAGAYMKSSWREGAAPEPAVLDVAGGEFPLPIQERVVLIGRRPTSDLPLMEASVSTAHAAVFEMEGARYIRDLGSRSGTFVNGQKVSQVELQFGDEIRIGDTLIRYAAAPVDYVEALPEEPAPVPVGEPIEGLTDEDLAALDDLPPLEPIQVPGEEPQPPLQEPEPQPAAAATSSPSWIEEELDALENQKDAAVDPESIEEALGLIQKEEVPQDVDLDEDPDVAHDAHATAKLATDPDKTALHPVISDQVVDLPSSTENDELKQQLSVSEDLLEESSSDALASTDSESEEATTASLPLEAPESVVDASAEASADEVPEDEMFRIPPPSDEQEAGAAVLEEDAAAPPELDLSPEPVAEAPAEQALIPELDLSAADAVEEPADQEPAVAPIELADPNLQQHEPAENAEDLVPLGLEDEPAQTPRPLVDLRPESVEITEPDISEVPLIRADAFDADELPSAAAPLEEPPTEPLDLTTEAPNEVESIAPAPIEEPESELELGAAEPLAAAPAADEADELDPLPLDVSPEPVQEPELAEVVEATEPTLESALELDAPELEAPVLAASDSATDPQAEAISDTTFEQSVEEFAGDALGPIVENEPEPPLALETPEPEPASTAAITEALAEPIEAESELELPGLTEAAAEQPNEPIAAEPPALDLPELELPEPPEKVAEPLKLEEPSLPLEAPPEAPKPRRRPPPRLSLSDLGADQDGFLGGAPLDLGMAPPAPPPVDFASLDSPAVPPAIPPADAEPVPPLDLDAELRASFQEDPPPREANIDTTPPGQKVPIEPMPPLRPQPAGPFASSPFELPMEELEPLDEAPRPPRKSRGITGFDGLAVPVQEADVFSQLFPSVRDEELLRNKPNPDAPPAPAKAPPGGDAGARPPEARAHPTPRSASDRPKSRERRFGLGAGPMLLLMVIAALAAAAVPYALMSQQYSVEARLRFRNWAHLTPQAQQELLDEQGSLLAAEHFRQNVIQSLESRPGAPVEAGFLREPRAFAMLASSRHWEKGNDDADLRLVHQGTDPDGDRVRMQAMLSQLFVENKDLVDDVNRNRERIETATRQIEQLKSRKQWLDERIRIEDEQFQKQPALAEQSKLEAELAGLDLTRKTVSALVARLQAEVEQLSAAHAAPATQPSVENDAELQRLERLLEETQQRLTAAKQQADASDIAEAARKRLDAEVEQFGRQIAEAQQQIEDNPDLQAYITAAQKLQKDLRELTGGLLLRQQEQHARLTELKRQLKEKMDLRRQTVWKNDSLLQQYEQQLAMEIRQYNAADSSGLTEEAQELKKKVDLRRGMIGARQAVLGDDALYADTIAQLEGLIAEAQEQLAVDREIAETTMSRLQQTFAQTQPTTRQLPAEQQALAAALSQRIDQIAQARQAYAAALNAGAAEPAAAPDDLQAQVQEITAQIEQRRAELASAQPPTPEQIQTRLVQRQEELAVARQQETEAHEAYFDKEKELRALSEGRAEASAAGRRADEHRAERDQVDQQLQVQETRLAAAQAALNSAAVPVEPDDNAVRVSPLPDPRPMTAGGTALVVVLGFAGLIYFTHGRAPRAVTAHPLPAQRLNAKADPDPVSNPLPADDPEPVTAQEA